MDPRAQGAEFLTARIRVPEHVVYRAFPDETVILNLQTGRYHGLNPTGRQMLDALERADSVAAALSELTEHYDVSPGELERDLRGLCAGLLERNLVEIDGGAP
jgi:hypothetical protein